ncbi:DNA repair protein complementing XP-C cells-like protein [Diplonema papillatum]|nr:DNA repair protein complementing XP-C cells-like protein [Diplonema papillatum]KAJ9460047.1 DNA repair protein complementing XP-C cells-like protein [Diplonema papillatum]
MANLSDSELPDSEWVDVADGDVVVVVDAEKASEHASDSDDSPMPGLPKKKKMPSINIARQVAKSRRADMRRQLLQRARAEHCFFVLCAIYRTSRLAEGMAVNAERVSGGIGAHSASEVKKDKHVNSEKTHGTAVRSADHSNAMNANMLAPIDPPPLLAASCNGAEPPPNVQALPEAWVRTAEGVVKLLRSPSSATDPSVAALFGKLASRKQPTKMRPPASIFRDIVFLLSPIPTPRLPDHPHKLPSMVPAVEANPFLTVPSLLVSSDRPKVEQPDTAKGRRSRFFDKRETADTTDHADEQPVPGKRKRDLSPATGSKRNTIVLSSNDSSSADDSTAGGETPAPKRSKRSQPADSGARGPPRPGSDSTDFEFLWSIASAVRPVLVELGEAACRNDVKVAQLVHALLLSLGCTARPVFGICLDCEWAANLRRVGRHLETAAEAAVLGTPAPTAGRVGNDAEARPAAKRSAKVHSAGGSAQKDALKNDGQPDSEGSASDLFSFEDDGDEAATADRKKGGGKMKAPPKRGRRKKVGHDGADAAAPAAKRAKHASKPGKAAPKKGRREGGTARKSKSDEREVSGSESGTEPSKKARAKNGKPARKPGGKGTDAKSKSDEREVSGSESGTEPGKKARAKNGKPARKPGGKMKRAAKDTSSESEEGSDPSPAVRSRAKRNPLIAVSVDELLDREDAFMAGVASQDASMAKALTPWEANFLNHTPRNPVKAVHAAADEELAQCKSRPVDHRFASKTWMEVLTPSGYWVGIAIPDEADSLTYIFTKWCGFVLDVTAKYAADYNATLRSRVETLDMPKEIDESGQWERYQVEDGSDGESTSHPERLWLSQTLAALNKYDTRWRLLYPQPMLQSLHAAYGGIEEKPLSVKERSQANPEVSASGMTELLAKLCREDSQDSPQPLPPLHVLAEIELNRRFRYKKVPSAFHKDLVRHNLFCAKSLLPKNEAVHPLAAPFCTMHQYEIHVRDDVAKVRGRDAWRRYGRQVRRGEKAVRKVAAVGYQRRDTAGTGLKDVFGPWQTQVYEAAVEVKDGKITLLAEDQRPGHSGFSLVDCPLPKNLAHVTGNRAAAICELNDIAYAKALVSFTRSGGFSRPNFDGVVVAKEYEDVLRVAVAEADAKRQAAADAKRSTACVKRWESLARHLLLREKLRATYIVPAV